MLTPRRLPSLNGLRAFEAAARHGSLAAAATELHVTPAAISRLVRELEQRLSVALFTRQANRLRLTAAGASFAPGLTGVFDRLAALTEEVTGAASDRVLTVGVGPTFAIRWLIPRLARFQAIAPDIEVRITTGGQAAPFADGWTCGIRLGDGHWPGLEAVPLVAAELLPVCAPAIAARIHQPSDLARETLLRVAHGKQDWPRWAEAAGVDDPHAHGPVFDHSNQAMQAAADGLGVAIGMRPYVDDDLAAGRLVAPFPHPVSLGEGWYLVHRPARGREPGFIAFRDWLLAEAAAPR
ncbi:transcriptional regulator GcvA [Humitalea sp. 24SJ18S-53]|uniref:transcriptional regulator GcvA n=1 Tax=Humitalea sp. 24SJ18S-53 TaxID=3422307 RepID=UPI003D66D644